VPTDRTTIYRGNRPTVGVLIVVLASLSAAAQRPDDKVDPTLRIVALDPRWTVAFESPPAAPAGYDAQAAYVPLKNGELVAVSLDDGDVLWKVPLAATGTPTTGDGLVFAAAEGAIHALEQGSGTTVWRVDVAEPLASPLYWDAGWLTASLESGELVAIRAQDGQIVWRQALGSPLSAPSSPFEDRLYVALRDGRVAALDMETGETAWTYPLKEEVTGLLALEDQLIVGTRANRVHSLRLSSGRIRWSQKAGGDIAGAPAADDDRIYFAAMDNVVRALDRDSGSIEWTRPITSRPAGGPLLTGDVVLVPLVTTDISAFAVRTGVAAFTIKAAGELGGVPYLRETPMPTAPRLIAISRDGKLQGFGSRFDPVPALLLNLPGVRVTG
jgi:outer membrane protein assembly factor BamB